MIRLSTSTCLLFQPPINFLPMIPILQMHLKVLARHLRSRRIQLPRTVLAPNPWEPHIFDSLAFCIDFGPRRRCWARGLRHRIHCGVAHHALKPIFGVGGLEGGEGLLEPLWRWRLSSVSIEAQKRDNMVTSLPVSASLPPGAAAAEHQPFQSAH